MKKIRQTITRIALVETGLIVGVWIVCQMIGLTRLKEFETALLIVGGVLFVAGVSFLYGNWSSTRNPLYQYARTMENRSQLAHLQDDIDALEQSTGLMMPLVTIGTITMFLSALIPTLLR